MVIEQSIVKDDQFHKSYDISEILFEITNRCLLNCVFCSTKANKNNKKFLDKDFIFSILHELQTINVKIIQLSGGEPFLHPDLLEISDHITKMGFFLEIYTSGTYSEGGPIPRSIFNSLSNKDKISLRFNLQSVTEKSHNNLVNYQYAFKNAITSIKNAINENIKTEIHFLPTTLNYKEIKPMINFCENLGVTKLKILRYLPQGRGAKNLSLQLNYKQLKSFMVELKEINSLSNLKIDIGKSFDCITPNGGKTCLAGKKKFLIDFNKNLFPCVGFKQNQKFACKIKTSLLDTIASSSFEHILDNVKQIRKKIKKEFIFGGCVCQFLWNNQNSKKNSVG